MQDKFWTPELLAEFFNSYPVSEPMLQMKMEQFKSSKSPKKEWEIVAFGERFDGRILQYKLQPSGLYRNEGDDCDIEYEAGQFVHDYEFIHSVRRLSDGEVFSVGDRIKNHSLPIARIVIDNGWTGGIRFECPHENEARGIKDAEKLPQPILTVVDGVQIFEADFIWVIDEDFRIQKYQVMPFDCFTGRQCFSTREAAEEYILNNRPMLSLNDVKKICEHSDQAKALAELTALVKQKLNQ